MKDTKIEIFVNSTHYFFSSVNANHHPANNPTKINHCGDNYLKRRTLNKIIKV